MLTPAQATQALIDAVIAEGLPSGTTNSLLDSLRKAYSLLTNTKSGDDLKACRHLEAFEAQVSLSLRKGRLTADQAAMFTTAADDIEIALGCP